MGKKDCTFNSTFNSTQKMETIDIQIPKGVRYMSDYPQLTSIYTSSAWQVHTKQTINRLWRNYSFPPQREATCPYISENQHLNLKV